MRKKTKTIDAATGTQTTNTLTHAQIETALDIYTKAPVPDIREIGPAEQVIAIIAKASTDPRCNVEKMRSLLDMQMELLRDQRRIEYNVSMKAAQEEMKPIVRMAENEKKKYAKLEHVDNALRPIYSKHGFSLSFNSRRESDNTITILCDVLHEAGHHESKELNGAVDTTGAKGSANKTQIQGVGSTVSYLRRYLTLMIFNVVLINEDDDGSGGKKPPTPNDKFAPGVADVVNARPTAADEQEGITPEQVLIRAAEELKQRILSADTPARKGEIMMRNIRLLKELEIQSHQDKADEIRKLVEIADATAEN